MTDLQQRTHAWLQSLLDIQQQTGDSAEFLEHVKVDLFPDSVYVFTPKSKIIALPRGATALDFAYTHPHRHRRPYGRRSRSTTNLRRCAPSCTTATSSRSSPIPNSRPSPTWLGFVRTGKARSAIRHHLRTINLQRIGRTGPGTAGPGAGRARHQPANCRRPLVERCWRIAAKSMDELYADIGIGKRMPALVARHIFGLIETGDAGAAAVRCADDRRPSSTRSRSTAAKACRCSWRRAACRSRATSIFGQLRRDQGLVVHTSRLLRWPSACAPRNRTAGSRSVGQRAEPPFRLPHPRADQQRKRLLARVAAEIGESDANIIYVGMDEDKEHMMTSCASPSRSKDRVHLAHLIRNMRRIPSVARILRERA